MNDIPSVIGHRGAAGHAPENTLASFRKAAALGARWVEFDARRCRDGHVVIFHDDTLERTTDGEGPVAARDLAGLKTLDAGGWYGSAYRGEQIPTLGETIGALKELGLGANVELKPAPGDEGETGAAVAAQILSDWPASLPVPVLSSFEEAALAAAREAAPDLPRALLVRAIPKDWQQRLEALDAAALHCRETGLTARSARAVVAVGYPLRCYTVNSRARARRLFGLGRRIGIHRLSGPAVA